MCVPALGLPQIVILEYQAIQLIGKSQQNLKTGRLAAVMGRSKPLIHFKAMEIACDHDQSHKGAPLALSLVCRLSLDFGIIISSILRMLEE